MRSSAKHALAMALALVSAPALACEYVTPHFDLCSEGTPWADGTWENGGNSAQLQVGDVEYEAYEPFYGSDEQRSLAAALDHILRRIDGRSPRTHHQRDRLATASLKIVRSIDTVAFTMRPAKMVVMMIASGGGHRVSLTLEAPEGTPVEDLDRLSRDYAALIVPTTRKTD